MECVVATDCGWIRVSGSVSNSIKCCFIRTLSSCSPHAGADSQNSMKCLAFCPCEKIIVDKDGVHSLITLMVNAELQLPPAKEIPKDAVAPRQWFIYTAWVPAPEDVGRPFEQVYQILWPNGDKFFEQRLPFIAGSPDLHQTDFSALGFPVGQSGRLRLLTWLDQEGRRVTDIIESFINVKHGPSTSPVTASTT